MLSVRGYAPLSYRQLGKTELDRVLTLDFPSDQVDRFLGSLHGIIDTVRRGPAHHLVGIEEADAMVGFYAVHPDRRDTSCWWLGWFGIDRRAQGGGRGGRVIGAIVERLRLIPGCREIRLLVAPDNFGARRLYQRAGFMLAGIARDTGELILQLALPMTRPSGEVPARFWAHAILLAVVDARSCRMGLPVSAKLHGEVAHPP